MLCFSAINTLASFHNNATTWKLLLRGGGGGGEGGEVEECNTYCITISAFIRIAKFFSCLTDCEN